MHEAAVARAVAAAVPGAEVAVLDDLISEQGLSKKKAGAAWLASLHAFVEKHSAQLPAGER